MEELRDKLIKLIHEKGILNEETVSVSQELDKIIVSYYKSNFQRHNK
jgi:hypothetical protein